MAKCGLFFTKLNLNFGLGVVLKNSTKDFKKFLLKKMCQDVLLNCLWLLKVKLQIYRES